MLQLALLAAVLSAPAPRAGHVLVYDERRGALMLLNGDHDNGDHDPGAATGEVWEWHTSGRRRALRSRAAGSPWQLTDTSGPPPRTLAAAAYDARRGVLVMQGGLGEGDTVYGDTQEWDGQQWRLVSTEGPGIRNHHAMVYDPARGVMVLFGGQDQNIVLQGDTWEWDGMSWRRAATSGPPARVHHAMAWDDVRQRVLLYGGSNGQRDFGDFWEWDGSSWQPIAAQGPSPGARAAHRMAFHAGERTVYLFGGFGVDDRVWIWDGAAWSRFAGATPPGRSHHAMAYHEARGSMVVFGGYQDGVNVNDTWELLGGQWRRVE